MNEFTMMFTLSMAHKRPPLFIVATTTAAAMSLQILKLTFTWVDNGILYAASTLTFVGALVIIGACVRTRPRTPIQFEEVKREDDVDSTDSIGLVV
jgi:hypothetical protein